MDSIQLTRVTDSGCPQPIPPLNRKNLKGGDESRRLFTSAKTWKRECSRRSAPRAVSEVTTKILRRPQRSMNRSHPQFLHHQTVLLDNQRKGPGKFQPTRALSAAQKALLEGRGSTTGSHCCSGSARNGRAGGPARGRGVERSSAGLAN